MEGDLDCAKCGDPYELDGRDPAPHGMCWPCASEEVSALNGKVAALELQVRDLWWLLENEPSGPGEGMVSSPEDSKLQMEWVEKYEMVRAGLPLDHDAVKRVCVHEWEQVKSHGPWPESNHCKKCGAAE